MFTHPPQVSVPTYYHSRQGVKLFVFSLSSQRKRSGHEARRPGPSRPHRRSFVSLAGRNMRKRFQQRDALDLRSALWVDFDRLALRWLWSPRAPCKVYREEDGTARSGAMLLDDVIPRRVKRRGPHVSAATHLPSVAGDRNQGISPRERRPSDVIVAKGTVSPERFVGQNASVASPIDTATRPPMSLLSSVDRELDNS